MSIVFVSVCVEWGRARVLSRGVRGAVSYCNGWEWAGGARAPRRALIIGGGGLSAEFVLASSSRRRRPGGWAPRARSVMPRISRSRPSTESPLTQPQQQAAGAQQAALPAAAAAAAAAKQPRTGRSTRSHPRRRGVSAPVLFAPTASPTTAASPAATETTAAALGSITLVSASGLGTQPLSPRRGTLSFSRYRTRTIFMTYVNSSAECKFNTTQNTPTLPFCASV